MQTLTAIIRARPGQETAVKAALLEVGALVRAREPETLGFFVVQDPADPCRFTTCERFADRAAMDHHNGGAGSKGFLARPRGCSTPR
jgi:quinol monooxygenase YgiN